MVINTKTHSYAEGMLRVLLVCCVFTVFVVSPDKCFVFSLFVLCLQKVFRVFTLSVVFSHRCFVFSLCVLCFALTGHRTIGISV